MNRPFDDVAKSLAGEMSRRESLRRVGGLLGGSALAYFGIGCAPDVDPVAPNLVRPRPASDVVFVGPTRFYLWEGSAAPVSPAVDAGWESSAAPFARRPMDPSPGVGDNLRTISGFSSTAGRDRCHRQFIGPPMAAGNVFDTSVTYKAYAQGLESGGNDNLRSRIGIRIVSRDGSTVRHTIKAIADYSSGTEWSTSLRSKAFLDGDAGTGSYTTVAGDRLVVEFGHRDAAGSSISGSSRWGSTATGGDVPENETTTSTNVRPWFECSLGLTIETAQVTQVTRYVNTASTPGGDGTTNDTVGASRAFSSLVTALTTLSATNWAAANQQLRILCSGTTPDTGDAIVTAAWNGRLSPECYLEIIGDQPSALAISTSHYRCVDTDPAGFGVYGGGYVRLSRVGYLITVGPGTGGYSVLGVVNNGQPMDVRFDRIRVEAVSIASGRTSSVHAFWTDASGPTNKVTYTNCVVVGWTGTGATHRGFTKYPGTTGSVRIYNGTAYGCGIGFASDGNGMIVKNCGAANCANGFNGTFDAASTNNASSLAADAPGTNARNSVTPTFVTAPSNLHLTSGDTAWTDHGADLSTDPLFPFSTDGDGATRTGTWEIGADG